MSTTYQIFSIRGNFAKLVGLLEHLREIHLKITTAPTQEKFTVIMTFLNRAQKGRLTDSLLNQLVSFPYANAWWRHGPINKHASSSKYAHKSFTKAAKYIVTHAIREKYLPEWLSPFQNTT